MNGPIKTDIVFAKTGSSVYLSHLDLVRLFTRVFRITNMPLAYSQGFNPHPRLSFQRALKLGLSSDEEQLMIRLERKVDLNIKRKEINDLLPQGLEIKKIEYREAA